MLLEFHIFQKCWARPRSGTAVFWVFLEGIWVPPPGFFSHSSVLGFFSAVRSQHHVTSSETTFHPPQSFLPYFCEPLICFLLDADHNRYLFCLFTCVRTSSPPHCKLRKAGTYLFYKIVFLPSNIVPRPMAVFNKYLLNERFSLFQWK